MPSATRHSEQLVSLETQGNYIRTHPRAGHRGGPVTLTVSRGRQGEEPADLHRRPQMSICAFRRATFHHSASPMWALSPT